MGVITGCNGTPDPGVPTPKGRPNTTHGVRPVQAADDPVMVGALITRLRDRQIGDGVAIVIYAILLSWFAYAWYDRRWPGKSKPIGETTPL